MTFCIIRGNDFAGCLLFRLCRNIFFRGNFTLLFICRFFVRRGFFLTVGSFIILRICRWHGRAFNFIRLRKFFFFFIIERNILSADYFFIRNLVPFISGVIRGFAEFFCFVVIRRHILSAVHLFFRFFIVCCFFIRSGFFNRTSQRKFFCFFIAGSSFSVGDFVF